MTDRTDQVYFEFEHTERSEVTGSRYTFCKIWDVPYDSRSDVVNGETQKPIGYGQAQCVPSDNFCKATGRKIAFTRALRYTGFVKAERSKIWEKYFEKMPL